MVVQLVYGLPMNVAHGKIPAGRHVRCARVDHARRSTVSICTPRWWAVPVACTASLRCTLPTLPPIGKSTSARGMSNRWIRLIALAIILGIDGFTDPSETTSSPRTQACSFMATCAVSSFSTILERSGLALTLASQRPLLPPLCSPSSAFIPIWVNFH